MSLLPFLLSLHYLAEARPLSTASRAQQPAGSDATVRVRIQNTNLGAVQVSTDSGKTWRLVGRVVEPVLDLVDDAAAVSPGVSRTSPDGAIIALGPRRAARVLPSKPGKVSREIMAITPPSLMQLLDGVFRASRVTIWLEASSRPVPLYEGYSPSDGDVLVLGVSPAAVDIEHLERRIEEAARTYDADARARYEKAAGKPVSGYLTVVARPKALAEAGPVVFLLDGAPVAVINRSPYSVRWDSRDWSDGEHLIEVRALDTAGNVLSRSKSLVYVLNRGRGG